MDFAKLIEQRDKFVADVATTLERRGIDASAIKNPVDVQAEQARRVRERIDSLEARKADLIADIDTELAELKRDLKDRDQKVADGKATPAATGTPAVRKQTLAAAAPAKARRAAAAPSAKAPARARAAAAAPSGKGRVAAKPAARKPRSTPSKRK